MMSGVLDLLLPMACPCCGAWAGGPCARCVAAFPPAPLLPVPAGLIDARAVFAYAVGPRRVVLACKAGGRHALVRHMAARMAALVDTRSDVLLTWVPTSPERARRRGFDHARLLAREVGRWTGLPVRQLLVRRSDAQEGHDRRERAQVVFGTIADHRVLEQAAGVAVIVVVDDVRTTGASLAAASSALLVAGAASVAGLTYAATPDRSRA